MNKRPYITLLLLMFATLANVVYCHKKNKKDYETENHNYENKFFTLDFENENYEMSDVEEQFFTTFPHDDPTGGNIVYDRVKWVNQDMIKLNNGEGLYAYIKYRDDSTFFDSFRFTTKAYFNLNEDVKKILFVFKGRLPSAKGVWPAWWLNGSRQDEWLYKGLNGIVTDDVLDNYSGKGQFYNTPSAVNSTDWPSGGEIDIIETINGDNIIHNTIHTCPQMCDSEWNDDGKIINCANAIEGDPNSGCSGKAYETEAPEGTFACVITNNTIWFYYWESGKEVRYEGGPLSNSPNPELWKNGSLKNTVKLFETDAECCNALHKDWQCESCEGSNECSFKNMKMIFNITLCGLWAGNKFDDTENSLNNCMDYIIGKGKGAIDNQFIKIEYVSVKKL